MKQLLIVSRLIMVIPFVVTLACSFVLIFYQGAVVTLSIVRLLRQPDLSPKAAKVFAVHVVESVDIFLIAIAAYIISIGLYSLFIDDKLVLPSWLRLRSLEELKENLVSVVIAVLAVLFLGEAVAWEGGAGITAFGAACALVIAALVMFLSKGRSPPPSDQA
ncbi:hypothetical protein BKE38_11180 [Pseudoroseomonas deserti]|uniref:YqhA family protein n=1 Tax=Teichococcus deserti TaxID=1817963 RepID=A0A1V2H588_9PROT|nr:YqhA family protein [Pseudoroseomonas deserti]ONG54030.1 hypothetical protein BKE38_11180 [Pseudoroseomonas deserti]